LKFLFFKQSAPVDINHSFLKQFFMFLKMTMIVFNVGH